MQYGGSGVLMTEVSRMAEKLGPRYNDALAIKGLANKAALLAKKHERCFVFSVSAFVFLGRDSTSSGIGPSKRGRTAESSSVCISSHLPKNGLKSLSEVPYQGVEVRSNRANLGEPHSVSDLNLLSDAQFGRRERTACAGEARQTSVVLPGDKWCASRLGSRPYETRREPSLRFRGTPPSP